MDYWSLTFVWILWENLGKKYQLRLRKRSDRGDDKVWMSKEMSLIWKIIWRDYCSWQKQTIKYECRKRCHLYEKSFEEIIAAGKKHREKVVSLTEIAKDRKSKMSCLCEDKYSLLDKLDKMELDAKSDTDLILRMTSETRSLKIDVRNLRMENIEKEEVIKEKNCNVEEIELYKVKSKDFEDEIFLKEHKIQELEEIIEKSKQTVGNNLEMELKSGDEEKEHLKVKVNILEDDIRKNKEAEKADKENRIQLFQVLDTLSEKKKRKLKKSSTTNKQPKAEAS